MPTKTDAEKDTERINWLAGALDGRRTLGKFAGSGVWYFKAEDEIYPLSKSNFRQAIDAAMEAEAHKGE